MKITTTDEKGFTLIEVIVSLVLAGIAAVFAGFMIVSVVNGYIFTKMNASTEQKAQLAITRLTKELSALQSIDSSGTDNISFSRVDTINTLTGAVTTITIIIQKSGTQLLVNDKLLTDSVHTFTLNYCDNNIASPTCSGSWAGTTDARIIEITLTLTGADNTPSTFTKRIAPRNI